MKNNELAILMPCFNEEENIGFCVEQAKKYIADHGINGEVIIIDNNSDDESRQIAIEKGARVIPEPRRGYGRALRTGLERVNSEVIIFGDCDSTYDFSNLDPLYLPLKENKVEFVIGDRFAGKMEQGAMSFLHRMGVPFLSWCGRKKFRVQIHDFHCGIRGIRKDALNRCSFHTNGMEFATEMIAEASWRGLRIAEVSVPLKVSQKKRKTKLHTIRDGFRHLWYIIKA